MKPPLKNEVRKPSKTLAGVTPIAVMCKPQKCKHGTCLYCPSLNVPQSYTPKSPPVLRAERLKYDAYESSHAEELHQLLCDPTYYDKNYTLVQSCYDNTTDEELKQMCLYEIENLECQISQLKILIHSKCEA